MDFESTRVKTSLIRKLQELSPLSLVLPSKPNDRSGCIREDIDHSNLSHLRYKGLPLNPTTKG